MTIGESGAKQVLAVSPQKLIRGLVEYYQDEGYEAKIHQRHRERLADVRVEADNGEIHLFKVVTSLPAAANEAITAWKRFDHVGTPWWICVPEEQFDQADELVAKAKLRNGSLCTWSINEEGELDFFDLPVLD
jgi:hypothetical protein